MKRKPLITWFPFRFAMLIAPLMAAWPQRARAVTFNWEGNAPIGVAGNGFTWTQGANWTGDLVPALGDDLVFGNPAATVGTIQLMGPQTANSLAFTQSYSLGAFGTNQVLTNTSGAVTVAPGVFATMNASYGGTNGIALSGGGALFMNHPLSRFAGNITVDGAGTTLVHRQEGLSPRYNGVGGSQEVSRFDSLSLGYTTATRTITLTNGGVYKVVGGGNNNEGSAKNVIIGTGGGTYEVAAGYQLMNLDDVGQISNASGNTLTKAGAGRLTITGALADTNPLAGDVVISGGMLDLGRLQGGVSTVGTRFAGITGTTLTPAATNKLTINSGGTLMLNNSVVGILDVASVVLNNGSLLAINGANHEIGSRTQGGATPASTLQINGTATVMHRDLYGAQTGRNFFINSALTGSGTLSILPSTQAGGNSRVVIQRSVGSTFDGTFRLNENANLEANPRFNATVDVGSVLAGGDVDFAGWGSTLDLRDSSATTSVFDYTANEVNVTTTQNGSLNLISVNRATTATGTGHLFNMGTLTMGSSRLGITGGNSYQVGFADTSTINGNAVIEMRTDGIPLVFSNAAALTEDAAGRSLTIVKTGAGNAAARDVISGGTIGLSNVEVATGSLILRGTNGSITTGFGGAASTVTVNGGANGFTNGLPTQGLLHLDSNGANVVGATTVIAAGNNNDRIADSATLNLRANPIVRMTSLNNTGTTETIGRTNVSGHATFDLIKTGTAPTPVALTLNNFTMVGAGSTANFTGTNLGLTGNNTTRIIVSGAVTGTMGAQYHSGNEWAKYDTGIDSGFALGVTPFTASDYTLDPAAVDTAWAVGQQLKLTSATGAVMSANRNVDTLNLQLGAANQSVNVAGFVLNVDQGGILSSGNVTGIVDGATAATPSAGGGISAGTTAASTQLYVHANGQLDIRTPIRDNAAGGSVDFVKSGTGTVRLIHQDLGISLSNQAISPYTATPWTSTMTGSWIVNDGRLEVHRGAFLGGQPVVMNGGHLEINQPVANANADSIIPGWDNDITVNGNASIVSDDNGESADNNGGDRNLVKFGSLTINNGSILSMGQFSDSDFAYMGGATFSGTPTLSSVRGAANAANILNGALTGSGFNMTAYNGGTGTVVLGGGQTDTAANTYSGAVTVYAGTLRLNKANGTNAITNSAAAEDLVINGGTVLWGAGHHGDLTSTNNINLTNNGLVGIAPTSPAAIKAAGQNQIADNASITLMAGTLGESDRITNEKFGALIQKNGTFNVGLGKIEVDSATISGGAMGFDRGGHFAAGSLTYLPGAYDQSVFTGLPTPGAQTTLEVGAGGISLTGQNITLGNGFSGNVAGAGGRLLLGGNLTFEGDDLVGGSFGRKGIFVQTGSSFRELGNSHVDLMGGTRDFNIANGSLYTITSTIQNGGLTKSGGGTLILENYLANTFSGGVTVNNGVISARSDGALGSSAGAVTVNPGGTLVLDGSWTHGNAFTVSGQGALLAGESNLREAGALVSETGTNRITGAFTLAADARVASMLVVDPSVSPAANGAPYKTSNLVIASAGGVTGTGTLNLSGHGDGVIVNGVNTSSGGLIKDGAGRWTISRAGSYTGATTITAGALRIEDSAALGSTASGTTVLGGSLELQGGLTVSEPITLNGAGMSIQSGALVNVAGVNTLSGPLSLGSATTLRSDAGRLIAGAISGTGSALTLSGPGDGVINGAITLGTVAGDALTKTGNGTWVINGGATMTGGTRVAGGSLVLGAGGTVLNPASPLTMAGGNFQNSTSLQTSAGLNLVSGGGMVGGGAGLTVGAINRSPGASASFTGNAVTSTTNVNGILGAYATVGSNWAAVDGSGLVGALSSYTPFVSASSTNNAELLTGAALTAAANVNSLKLTGGSGLAQGANNITLGAGGLLTASNLNAGISGTGVLSGATANDELIVHSTGASFDLGVPLIGAGTGGLTKTGNGRLVLSGTSAFTGGINVNGGTLSIVGPGGTTHPLALGSATGPRDMTLNGGTFEVVGGDYDNNASTIQYVIGSGGGTIRSTLGSLITINDGSASGLVPTQLRGTGDLTFAGGGRYSINGGTPEFSAFTGNTTVEGGILTIGHQAALGGRPEQLLTLKPGSAVINNANTALGLNGLVNNISAQGGVEFFALGGSRTYAGNVQLAGTNTIALLERDTVSAERQMVFNGRVSGTGVTLNVVGVNNNSPFYLASGSNDLTGTINLGANAVLEARTPGSLGVNAGDVTINLAEANSRVLLRHWQNGDFRSDINVSNHAEINSDRLVNYAGGANQLLSINNLTVAANKILTFGGGNGYTTRVAGTATFSGDTILNAAGGSGVLFENGMNFAAGASLNKRGGASLVLNGAANHTGETMIQQGFVILQNAGGSLPNTSAINLRGGELRVDNSNAVNANRINDSAAITLGGGTLRVTGAETLGAFTAPSGNSNIFFNQVSDTVAGTLNIPSLNRSLGATVNFGTDFGGAVGSATLGNSRVSSRIIIGGQANVTGNSVIPGYFGLNGLDFVQYDGTSLDAYTGLSYGVRELRNPTPSNGPTYQNDTAETAWDDADIVRVTSAKTLTANRALEALKVEAAVTLAMADKNLRIETGGIIVAGNAVTLSSTTGVLTAGAATATAGTAELFLGGNNTLTLSAIVGDNAASGQKVALVKTGTGTVILSANNAYTGGTWVNSGTLTVNATNSLGASTNPIYLNGGTLNLNAGNASSAVALGGFGQSITANANSTIILDNGALTGTDNDYAFGALNINGPYTLGLRGFDSMDATFTAAAHNFIGTPTLDMAQAGSGSPASTFTLNGAITGSGFRIESSGNNATTASILQLGGGEAIANTYTGNVSVMLGSNSAGLVVQLNKAAGTTAITGDLEINGGIVRNLAADQIADTSNMTINQGSYDAFGKNETFASVTMRGGNFRTSSGATGGNTVTVTGDINAIGADDLTGSGDGVAVNSNSTLAVNGMLRLNGYSRGTMGGTASNLIVGGLEMTGTTLSQGGAGSLMRLNGDVTTLASSNTARLGATTTGGAQIQLNGTRTFTVADGSAGLDFSVSSALTNSSSPVTAGSLIKAGAGTMQLEGAGLVNAYTGTTTVNEGSLILFKSPNVDAIPAGALTIGDGTGGAKADKVIIRNSNQIADANNVVVSSSGLLDLETFNTSEQISSLAGSGAVDLGPGSVLTVQGTTSTVFSGSMQGAGGIIKAGTSTLELSGLSDLSGATVVNGGKLTVNGTLASSPVTVNTGATLAGSGNLGGPLTVADGGIFAPGNSPGTLTTTNSATFGATSVLNYEFNGADMTVGGGVNDLFTGITSLTLGGSINVTETVAGSFLSANPGDMWRIFDYSGPLSGSLAIGGTMPTLADPTWSFVINTDTANQVNLQVVPESSTAVLAGLTTLLALRRRRRAA